jgi:helix-turn-helix protein
MDTMGKRLVPIPEARQVLGGIGHTTVYELVKRGEIIKVNIGRRGFITSESLEAYMDRLSADSEVRTPRVRLESPISKGPRDARTMGGDGTA